jgi:hypothetical protein
MKNKLIHIFFAILVSLTGFAYSASDVDTANALLAEANKLFIFEGKRNEALTRYDSLLNQFSSSSEPELLLIKAIANYVKATILFDLNRPYEAINSLNIVIEQFDHAEDLISQDHLASALMFKSEIYISKKAWNQAIDTNDIVIARFGASKEPALQMYVAAAFNSNGLSIIKNSESIKDSKSVPIKYKWNLDELNRGIACFDEVLVRFSKSTDPQLIKAVAEAQAAKKVALGFKFEQENAH